MGMCDSVLPIVPITTIDRCGVHHVATTRIGRDTRNRNRRHSAYHLFLFLFRLPEVRSPHDRIPPCSRCSVLVIEAVVHLREFKVLFESGRRGVLVNRGQLDPGDACEVLPCLTTHRGGHAGVVRGTRQQP